MTPEDHANTILTELLQLDPSLGEHEADLRSRLALLTVHAPTVVPDPEFSRTLRERLTSVDRRPIISPYSSPAWWAVRLIPLGVVALLVLTVLPERTHYLPIDTSSTESVPSMTDTATPEMRTFSTGAEETTMAPASAPNTENDTAAKSTGAPVSTMQLKSVPTEPIPGPITISPQQPGLSVRIDSVTASVPGFVVIYSYLPDGSEHLRGISPYILPGTTTGIPVYVNTPIRGGETLVAMLCIDNGDHVFTYGTDLPVRDQSGNPVTVPIIIAQ